MRPEYPADLIRSGVRGKYAARYREGTNLVFIEPDLREHFHGGRWQRPCQRDRFAYVS